MRYLCLAISRGTISIIEIKRPVKAWLRCGFSSSPSISVRNGKNAGRQSVNAGHYLDGFGHKLQCANRFFFFCCKGLSRAVSQSSVWSLNCNICIFANVSGLRTLYTCTLNAVTRMTHSGEWSHIWLWGQRQGWRLIWLKLVCIFFSRKKERYVFVKQRNQYCIFTILI